MLDSTARRRFNGEPKIASNVRGGLSIVSPELESGEFGTSIHVQPESGPRFEHCNLSLRAAVEGQGVALAYGALVAPDLATGTLVRLFDINLPATVIYSLVCPASYVGQPRVAAFREWLIAAAELDNLQAEAQAAHVPIKAVG